MLSGGIRYPSFEKSASHKVGRAVKAVWSAWAGEYGRGHLLVGVDNRLAVRCRPPRRLVFELLLDLLVVVDLPVDRERLCPVVVEQGLVARQGVHPRLGADTGLLDGLGIVLQGFRF